MLTKTALNDMFWGVTWFSRVWVVQEVALSQKSTFIYGRVTLPYFHLIKSWSDLYTTYKKDGLVQNLNQTLYNGFGTHITSLQGPRRAVAITEGYDGVEELFRQASRLLATEPRDKVYGLYGLLVSYGISLPDPDYSKPLQSIYMEATKGVIKLKNSLSLLMNCFYSSDDWPSWVPNWADSLPPSSPKGTFRTPKSSKLSFDFVDLPNGSQGLRTTAFVIAGVSSTLGTCLLGRYRTAETLRNDSILPKVEQQVAADWKDERLKKGNDIDKFLAVYNIRILQRTLKYTKKETNSPEQWREDLYEIVASQASLDMHKPFSRWLEILSTSSNKLQQDHTESSSVDNSPEMELYKRISANEDVSQLHELFTASSYFWTFFKTDSGVFGAGAHAIAAGDKIALISGFGIPMVIRPVLGDHYRLITPAYICGAMQGEAWPSDLSSLKIIVII